MKKVSTICSFVLLIFAILLSFGFKYIQNDKEISSVSSIQYKQIPNSMKDKYKIEIESYINEKTDFYRTDIDKNSKEIYDLYQKIHNDKNRKANAEQYIIDIEEMKRGFLDPIFYLYKGLIEITSKYVDIEDNIPATDFYITLADFINPYLENNNIDTKRLYEFNIYSCG